jgi:hypothetical protein
VVYLRRVATAWRGERSTWMWVDALAHVAVHPYAYLFWSAEYWVRRQQGGDPR